MKKNTTVNLPMNRVVLAACLLSASLLSSPATTRYWNGNVSQDWSNPNNFQSSGANLPGVPQAGDTVVMETWAARIPLINNSGHAPINDIYLNRSMTVDSGGALDTTYFKLARNASAALTINGGSLTAGNHLDIGGYFGATATMDVFGGTVTVGGLYLNLDGSASGASYLNLAGGTLIDTGALSINSTHPAVIDLRGGTLVVPASQAGNVNYWIGSGNILGFGTLNAVNVASVSGNLVLTAIPEPSTLALLSSAVVIGLVALRRKS